MIKTDKIDKLPKPSPFYAPGSTSPIDKETIEKRERAMERAESVGESVTRFDSIHEGYENPYRLKALVYISNDEEVPEDLKEKIKEYDEKHLSTDVSETK